jgi:hypothetical protein
MKGLVRIIIFLTSVCLWGILSYSHVQKVHLENQFYRTINRRSIIIAFFYREDKCTRQDPYFRRKLNSTLAYFERMSRLPWYDDGDCLFISVNVVTEELCALMRSLGIKQLPCYMLFYNSVPVRGSQGQLAQLNGFVPRNILEDFIERFAGGTIEDNIQERAEQRRIAREEALLRYEYYAPCFYWGYPYWGCGYPCGGCYGGRFGCSVGFGFCGCGY